MNAGTADPSAAAMAATTTFVMVGKTGTGKSATGNLLLGREDAFKSSSSVVGVTSKCKLEETADGSLAVIDTPGLSDDSSTVGELFQEIGRSVELAGPGGITAIIIVLSLSTRVTEEDLATIELLAAIFSGTPTSGYANDKWWVVARSTSRVAALYIEITVEVDKQIKASKKCEFCVGRPVSRVYKLQWPFQRQQPDGQEFWHREGTSFHRCVL